jgi:tripartite-type tricarboxylate transporter receptor subunit TctC
MRLPSRGVLLMLSAAAFACAIAATAQAQAPGTAGYPNRPVRIVVGFAPGGGTDIVGRIAAQKLNEATGQSFYVENRPGASATIATALVAKAAPDGYTLTIGAPTSHSVAPLLLSKVNYDPLRDFAPITMLAKTPALLVVHPSLPVQSVADLIRLAKARPGQLSFGAGGTGTGPHLAGELFKQMAGVDMLFVPYKGEGPAIADLIGGQISLMFPNAIAVLPQVRAGKLRGIAVTALARVSTLREFPTMAESGLPGFEVESWYGLLAPAGTPHDIIAMLNSEMTRMLSPPEIRARLAAQGLFVSTSTPDQLAALMKAELIKWAKVIKEAGLKLD